MSKQILREIKEPRETPSTTKMVHEGKITEVNRKYLKGEFRQILFVA